MVATSRCLLLRLWEASTLLLGQGAAVAWWPSQPAVLSLDGSDPNVPNPSKMWSLLSISALCTLYLCCTLWGDNTSFIHINHSNPLCTDRLRLSEQNKAVKVLRHLPNVVFSIGLHINHWLQTSWGWQGTSRLLWWLEERLKDVETDLWIKIRWSFNDFSVLINL